MTIHQLQLTPWRIVSAAATWHVTSQQHARRNALIASTALAQRRKERLDVEDFLARYDAPHDVPHDAPLEASQHRHAARFGS